jgi:methylated-DNA-[protein]-cysteine S-methyltransferase
MRFATVDSPIGELLLCGDSAALRGVWMQDPDRPRLPPPDWIEDPAAFGAAAAQLAQYFAGERTAFDLPLAFDAGTPFQQQVWHELRRIPYGETISYGELARRVGRPDRARAVGGANGRNPIPVIVPCHRVIGADGSLVGFGGGLERKRILLELERGQLVLS